MNKFSIAVILFFTLLLSFTSGVKAEMCSCECICSSLFFYFSNLKN